MCSLWNGVLCPQRDDFAQHAQTVFEKADFASFSVIPPHRNLLNTQAGAVRQEKQFDIKRETIDPCFLQRP